MHGNSHIAGAGVLSRERLFQHLSYFWGGRGPKPSIPLFSLSRRSVWCLKCGNVDIFHFRAFGVVTSFIFEHHVHKPMRVSHFLAVVAV